MAARGGVWRRRADPGHSNKDVTWRWDGRTAWQRAQGRRRGDCRRLAGWPAADDGLKTMARPGAMRAGESGSPAIGPSRRRSLSFWPSSRTRLGAAHQLSTSPAAWGCRCAPLWPVPRPPHWPLSRARERPDGDRRPDRPRRCRRSYGEAPPAGRSCGRGLGTCCSGASAASDDLCPVVT